jgi:hypothetical protein
MTPISGLFILIFSISDIIEVLFFLKTFGGSGDSPEDRLREA